MRRLWTALIVVASLVLAGGVASGAPIVALQDDNLPNLSGPALEARLDLLAATGVKVTRVDVLWREVAPRPPLSPRDPGDPAYSWARYDQILLGLRARGIGAIVGFYLTPVWASRSGARNAAPRASDGSRFAGAIARRYSGGYRTPGGTILPAVRRIEVWNEPNLAGFWMPQCRQAPGRSVPLAPRAYAALLAASYREIKSASPTTLVVGGVTGPAGRTPPFCEDGASSVGSVDFARLVSREGPPIDAWSMHLYPIGSPLQAFFEPSWSTLPRVLPHVDRLRAGAPIYVTETGYHTSYNRYHRYFVSEAQQAAYVDETFAAAARVPRVEVATWFNLQDNPFWTGGLLRADGARKPSWDRLSALARATPVPPGWAP